MSTTTVVLPEDALAAVALALEGAANPGAACQIIDEIIDMAGPFDGTRTEPTKILIDAIQARSGTFAVDGWDGTTRDRG